MKPGEYLRNLKTNEEQLLIGFDPSKNEGSFSGELKWRSLKDWVSTGKYVGLTNMKPGDTVRNVTSEEVRLLIAIERVKNEGIFAPELKWHSLCDWMPIPKTP